MSAFCRTVGSGFCRRARGTLLRQRDSHNNHLAITISRRVGRPSSSTAGDLPSLLARVAAGNLSPSAAAAKLAPLLVSGGAEAEDVGGFAKIDHDRSRRVGFPEVVFGEGKSAEQIIHILKAMIREARESSEAAAVARARGVGGGGGAAGAVAAAGAAGAAAAGEVAAAEMGGVALSTSSPIVATRVSAEKWLAISAGLPGLRYHADARIVSFGASQLQPPVGAVPTEPAPTPTPTPTPTTTQTKAQGTAARGGGLSPFIGKVAVLSAGTSDLAVAEEAAVLAELAGAEVSRFHDVGVAGIHRLLGVIPQVEQAGVAICVAGMDGAMPGVVAGLVKCPVVAVPTSVGYGAAMSGLAPLLTMLNACAPGVSVVNIDNGFGAAAFAVKLLKSSSASTESGV